MKHIQDICWNCQEISFIFVLLTFNMKNAFVSVCMMQPHLLKPKKDFYYNNFIIMFDIMYNLKSPQNFFSTTVDSTFSVSIFGDDGQNNIVWLIKYQFFSWCFFSSNLSLLYWPTSNLEYQILRCFSHI